MKVRTDFVTNSSSSSFVVNLSMELKNWTSLTIDTGDCSGDFESKDLCVKAEDASKTKIFEEAVFFDESDDFFYYDVNDFVGDIQFGHLNLAEVLCCKDISESTKKIEQAFLTVGALDAFEEDNEDESAIFEQYDEATKEVILQAKEKIEKIAEFLHIFFFENIKSKEDIKKISVSMEASGRGEFLAEPVELLRKLFGWNNRDDVCDILEEKEDEFGDILFALVNIARWNKIDPEVALSKANQKFTKRFNQLEELCNKPLNELSFEEYDELWQKAKKLTK